MILIQNGVVQLQDLTGKYQYQRKDILIKEDRILQIADRISSQNGMEIIDAEHCLVMPGLINAHVHSHDHFNKGCMDNEPLELWMMKVRPFFGGDACSPEEIYLRTILGAIEMLKSGTTSVMDDVILDRALDDECLDAVMKAYRDIGMRAVVCPHIKNLPMEKTIPGLEDTLPRKFYDATAKSVKKEPDIIKFLNAHLRNNADAQTVTMGLSASAPQRCSISLMQQMKQLSLEYGVPLVCHILETRIQKETGYRFYGKSLVRYLEEHDLLFENLVAIHLNYIEEEDIPLLEEKQVTAVHNPVCNLKMGSGIAPVKRLLCGLPMGLGTDNMSANDSVNLFETMKMGALISKIRSPDPAEWLNAQEVLSMATVFGSRCMKQQNQIGRIQEGFKADLVLLDLRNERMVCAHDLSNALVYAENGKSVKSVMVDGKLLVKDGVLMSLNEASVYQKIAEIKDRIVSIRKRSEKECAEFIQVFEKIYREITICHM